MTKYAVYELTHDCNFDCIHCCVSRENHKININEQIKIIDALLSWPNYTTLVGGGEPFLVKNIIDILSPFLDQIKR